jgi:2-C-methyl-D-erythritol 2,4-cyclodiphosphate synthase
MSEFRTGLGFDVHRLATGRRLVLAGVEIPHDLGLLGHSDADVALHALCDAMLGAAGMGDIGELFPDNDPAHRDRDSAEFVAEVRRRVEARGWRLQNVDLIIAAEQPKLKPHKAAMRARLAALLDLPEDAIGLKAGTHEGLDAIGRGLAIGCWANVLLMRDRG